MSISFLWAAAAAAHLLYYSVTGSRHYREQGRKLFERKGVIPAPRGIIFDSEKKKLAWNERYYNLYLKPYNGFIGRRKMVFKALKKIFRSIEYSESENIRCIKKHLSPDELVACVKIIKHYPELEIKSEIKRCYAGIFRSSVGKNSDITLFRSIIGDVEEKNGIFYGKSGYEKKFDSRLRGKSGKFTVLIDRTGNWIPGTWHEQQKSVPGSDVILKYSIEELIRRNKNER
jgi:cell division protein FtsI/penicillin-binding protein 2